MLKTVTNIVNVSQITGVLPVVNGGTGVTTSTGTGSTVLSAAPTLSSNVTLSTGNLIVASGQGIDFSATPGTGTSELLNDYEEGTWTPTFEGTGGSAGAVAFTSGGNYVKVGKQVTILFNISVTNLGSWSGNARIGGLPFASAAGSDAIGAGYANAVTYVGTLVFATAGSSSVGLTQTSTGSASNIAVSAISTSGFIYAALTYISN